MSPYDVNIFVEKGMGVPLPEATEPALEKEEFQVRSVSADHNIPPRKTGRKTVLVLNLELFVMSSRNPSNMLAESIADFSKSAYQAFTEVQSQARQEIAQAVAQTQEVRAERDKAMRDLRTLQLESQSLKEDAALSKAAFSQAELTIAHQAETLVNQLETIAQLRRELNQWKDQARNWQEHFLRVEEERCAQSSRIDEFIMEKLETFQPAARLSTSANPFVTPNTSKQLNQINSAPSSIAMKPPASPRRTQPPAYRPNAESAASEELLPNGFIAQANSTETTVPHPTSDSTSRRPKLKSQQFGLKEGTALSKTTRNLSNGKKSQKSSDNNHATGTTSAQSHSSQQTSSAQSNIRTSTVIRHVQAVINVKSEEDDLEGSGEPARSSPSSMSFLKRKNEDLPGLKSEDSKKGLINRRGTALISDDEESGVQSEEEDKGSEGGTYRLRKTSRLNYREEDDNEDDELLMGAEENHDELYGTHPIDQSRQQAAAPSRKKRKYSLR